MYSRRAFLVMCAGMGTMLFLPGCRSGKNHSEQALKATAITDVFGDGIRFVAIAVEYEKPLSNAELSVTDFTVEGRTITDVFTSTSMNPDDKAAAGNIVIIRLSPDDTGAVLSQRAGHDGHRSRAEAGGEKDESHGASGEPPAEGKLSPGGPPAGGSDTTYLPALAVLSGSGAITAEDGTVLPDFRSLETSATNNLIVDDFIQQTFNDPDSGDELGYNLYVPEHLEDGQTYPLVLFMHDAGATSSQIKTTLKQGLGAICWASPADQKARPCFVLAPQYAEIIVNDNSEATSMLDTTINLVKSLTQTYAIDTDRLYTTGQSGGCMMSIAMDIKYPDFFAASFLVAGQWGADLVKPMAKQKLWILVSQDDSKAYPGQNQITEVLEQQGAEISRAVWDGTWNDKQYKAAFDKIDAENSPINYVVFKKGTVIPQGQSSAGASGHRNTWRLAYSIEPVREWIFRQSL